MPKVAFYVTNSQFGLHQGHRSVIEFGKNFGEVEVRLIENLPMRNSYVATGQGTNKYRIDATKIRQDCEELHVDLKLPEYVSVPEPLRQESYTKAYEFASLFLPQLLTPRYVFTIAGTLAYHRLCSKREQVLVVTGPEVLFFVLKRIEALVGNTHHEIYPHIIKGTHGLKESSTLAELPEDALSRLRAVINGARDRYKVGRNDDLVLELNDAYPPTVGWRAHEILVYEGGFVSGRLEISAFKIRTSTGPKIVEEIDYYA